MGRIIDRRRVMGGESLPYDAKIEYLESTGTQWIDTLVNQKETQRYLSVEVKIQVPVLETGEHEIVGSGSGNTPTMGYSGTYYFTWANSSTTWKPKTSNVNWHNNIYTFYTEGGRTFSENGVIYQSNYSNNFTGGAYNTLFLFASSPNRFPLKCRIKYVKIIIDDIVRFDAISVRVGTTGYLYDKVSKQLFGNAGTGDFILGPDKGTQNYTEIEYLESTGTQFIDTDIVPNTRLAFTIELQQTSEETSKIALGGRLSSSYDYSLWMGKEAVGAHYCKGTDSSSYDAGSIYTGDMTDRFHLVTVSYVGISMDGNSIYTFPDIPFLDGGGESLAIFALKDSGVYDSRTFRGRIKKVVIELNGIIVRDYIPVRVGNIGYMYDKVSKQLFGNAGTGAFILGPDK